MRALLSRVSFWLLIACVLYLLVVNAKMRRLQAQRDKAQEAVLVLKAQELGAIRGELKSERAIRAGLSDDLRRFADAMRATDKRATVASSSSTTVHVSDTVHGSVNAPDSVNTRTEWRDEHHRFRFTLPAGPLERRQSFRLSGVVVRGVTGSRFERVDFAELDPETGERIPLEGVEIAHEFKYTEEKESVSRWHVRAVAAVDHRAAFGAGAQVNPAGGLTVGLVGLYDRKDSSVTGALHLGYRLRFPGFNSTLSVGPYVGLSSNRPGAVLGLAGTLEVTR